MNEGGVSESGRADVQQLGRMDSDVSSLILHSCTCGDMRSHAEAWTAPGDGRDSFFNFKF